MCVRERKCVRVCRRLCFTSSLWWNDNAEARWMGYALCVGDSCSPLFSAHSHPHFKTKNTQRLRYQTRPRSQTGRRCCTSRQQFSNRICALRHMWALHNSLHVPIALISVESESSSKVKSFNRGAAISKNCDVLWAKASLYSQVKMILLACIALVVCTATLSQPQSLCLDKKIPQIKTNLRVYISFHMRTIYHCKHTETSHSSFISGPNVTLWE